jgi:hypothetical protein
MVTTTGKFDGKQVILDTIPEGLIANTRVRVTIEKEAELTGLDAIAAKARKTNLPSDFAAQHHHYVKGLPKR